MELYDFFDVVEGPQLRSLQTTSFVIPEISVLG
jgi:hypothetical protein